MSSVLFVGGTGQISRACVERVVAQAWAVTLLNRGTTTCWPVPEAVHDELVARRG